MTVDLQVLLTIAVNIVLLVGGVVAFVVWLRKWLRAQVSEPMRLVADRTKTRNEHTVGELVEDTSSQLTKLQEEVSALTKTTVENRIMLQDLGFRLDRHLTTGHGMAPMSQPRV